MFESRKHRVSFSRLFLVLPSDVHMDRGQPTFGNNGWRCL